MVCRSACSRREILGLDIWGKRVEDSDLENAPIQVLGCVQEQDIEVKSIGLRRARNCTKTVHGRKRGSDEDLR